MHDSWNLRVDGLILLWLFFWTGLMHYDLGGGFKYFLFSPRKLGKWSNLTNIFQMGRNHQLVIHLGWMMFLFEIPMETDTSLLEKEAYFFFLHFKMEPADCTNIFFFCRDEIGCNVCFNGEKTPPTFPEKGLRVVFLGWHIVLAYLEVQDT